MFESETLASADVRELSVLVVALGVARRAGARRRRLVVDELVEDLVDHPEVALGVGELLLDVDQVAGEAVEPGGRRAQDRESGAGVARSGSRVGSSTTRTRDVVDRPDRRGRRSVEHRRHLAEHRAGVSIRANGTPSRSITTAPGHQHQQPAAVAALVDHAPRRPHDGHRVVER